MKNIPKVVILQYRLLHYRVAFFELLRKKCLQCGIDLHLIHGQASRRELAKKDEGVLDWAITVKNTFFEIGEKDLVWQPVFSELLDCDLVVIMQENRILSNYYLLLKRIFGGPKIAYWGHGANFQSTAPTGLREKWKRFLLTKVDWWFAYTQITVDLLINAKYPVDQITCLDNSIDTDRFKVDLASFSASEIAEKKSRLGFASNAPVGVFCGSLYPEKNLEFLIDSADFIKSHIPEFCLVIIGDGPSMPVLQNASFTRPWMKLLGVRTGREKALYFKMADIMLNPGLVGLHIVDAFCSGLVLCTTENARHSPEISYLVNGENGLMTTGNVDIYGQSIVDLLSQPVLLERMKKSSIASGKKYTLNNMVSRFAGGINNCLAVQEKL